MRPLNLQNWINENRDLLKPPVGNKVIYKNNEDFIVMVVGGPNARKDYHFNEGEELFYQIEGNITLKIIENGKPVDIQINKGDLYLLPPKTPHSPRRGPNTVGLVIERYRKTAENDGFMWYCENCGEKLYEEFAHITDIVTQLPPIMNRFYADVEKCVCKKCGVKQVL